MKLFSFPKKFEFGPDTIPFPPISRIILYNTVATRSFFKRQITRNIYDSLIGWIKFGKLFVVYF